ncbi:DUF3883 domain-containing protein [Actinomadura montaniterrae]|uniref:DUF3883 domain-containing protein n=1 Tax=Actinomadura montaniterrae TaxID=1803903 RepID=A0A6L3VK52_9ACTN|nr:DUF3883 domain-containing protein [Actinomadura montaniterrae]KAB2371551.1 DUF3883 domain-containing protein [Actinomadura montaniterrae]
MFAHVGAFSDLTPAQYEWAFSWLQETGLLADLHSPVPAAERVLEAALRLNDAPWMADADSLVRSPGELPEDLARAAESLGVSAEHAFGTLRSVWGKFDDEQRLRVGAAAEAVLMELLTASVDARVEHVAAHSDGYGYDIAVHARQGSLHIEVKSTLRRNRITVFLSRNEYEVMLRDPSWQMVVVRLDDHLKAVALASVPGPWILRHAPHDRSATGRWQSFRLDVPPEQVVPGISRLAPVFAAAASPLLTGSQVW